MRIGRIRSVAAAVVAAVTLALVPATGVLGAERAAFDPGDIISDDSFFNPDAMTAADMEIGRAHV